MRGFVVRGGSFVSRLSNGANVFLTDDGSVLARWYDCGKWAVVVSSIDLFYLW